MITDFIFVFLFVCTGKESFFFFGTVFSRLCFFLFFFEVNIRIWFVIYIKIQKLVIFQGIENLIKNKDNDYQSIFFSSFLKTFKLTINIIKTS